MTILYPTKCTNCGDIKENTEIHNYVVKYESWEAYNCCCESCARKREAERFLLYFMFPSSSWAHLHLCQKKWLQ